MKIESPADEAELLEFVRFEDLAHAGVSARWPALEMLELPRLTGQSALTAGKPMRPFVARENGEIVARALAVVDPDYARRWNDRLGHLAMFEARRGTREAVKQMIDAACRWMQTQGAEAARAGFLTPLDAPFAIDAYD